MDLCITTSMSSNEWAAWIQAIGSLLAIFVAVGLGVLQWLQARKAVLEKRKSQYFLVAHWAKEVSDLFRDAYVAGLSRNVHLLNRVGLQLDDLTRWSTSFVVDTFEPDTMKAFVQVRSCAHEFSAWSKGIDQLLHQEAAVFTKTVYQRMIGSLPIFAIAQPNWSKGDPVDVLLEEVI